MKTLSNILAASLLLMLAIQSMHGSTQIKLSGRKDLVLNTSSRKHVLEVAQFYLTAKDEAFLSDSADVDTPFAFEQPVVALVNGEAVDAKEATVINYDEASVLRVVVQNFSQQVRGTLARGDVRYLQLNGGSLLKPGASFPVSIPQAQGQTFTVTITEISGDGYTLKLGAASQTIHLSGSGSSAGAIKLN
ncbi:hypothetical protein QEH59_01310 [Coraliomargarita sp. SDUM461004]|uniref:Alginate biosynthesis protein AlgF n=1 Tax=Thalassobacterium sedimentorum TaxID=3041258 RepID=A0ABU1AE55_9BACT|nr:hypothetical protein [Coraliomargarita sp. SDUM461004]MDQ8193044.1 hypothetical protein [Coraliomargarita sp. SDUM461004]